MIKWYIVGDGSMKGWVEEQILLYGLHKTVIVLGKFPLERMPSFYKCANLLLVSMQNRQIFSMTIPSKVQAYLSSGVPIIGMLNGEGAQIIKQSKSGYVCASGDYKSLAESILKLSKTPKEDLFKMGQQGRGYSEKHFNREHLISTLEKYLTNIKFYKN